MTNLLDLLWNWDSNVQIIVESKEESIYKGNVAGMPKKTARKYWVLEESVKKVNEDVFILVEHEAEMNRKLEKQNSISFSAIWECIRKDSAINEEIKAAFDSMIRTANHYVYYRKNFHQISVEMLGKFSRERSLNHDLFISELNYLSELIEKTTNNLISWRIVLGNDRHTLGEFAEYIIDSIKKNKKRIEILEALIWAQEHQNQIHYLLSNASNGQEAGLQLMNKYNFDYDQSQAIIDMRLKAFCDEEKEKCRNELDKRLDVEKLYPEI